jgi:hypothetical protein
VIPKGKGCADDARPLSYRGFRVCCITISLPSTHGELLPMQELSTKRLRLLWCFSCGTETTYTPDCEWVWIILPGMKSELEV